MSTTATSAKKKAADTKKTTVKVTVKVESPASAGASITTALAGLTPPQREAYEKMYGYDEANVLSDLSRNWEFGRLLREIADDVNTYGSNFIATLARLLNHETSYLYKRLKFFSQYSFDDMNRLKSMRMAETNTPLTWTHLQAVIPLDDAEERWDLLKRACANNWTPGELIQHVRQSDNATSDRRRGATGRPISIPPTVDGKLSQIRETLPVVCKRARGWADASDGLLAAIRSTAPERVRPAWLREVQEAQAALARLEEETASCRAQLASAEEYLTELSKTGPRRGKKSAETGDDLFKE